MPLVSIFGVGAVRLDLHQAHGAAGAVRALPMIEIRRHDQAFLPPSGATECLFERDQPASFAAGPLSIFGSSGHVTVPGSGSVA